ncbi:MAG TPA: tetratricopeptide repeat protein [Candidatus Methylacidiphilales bacterium]|nr:tetratricopeptide repeat protein [Candidatus Methylacidiphilales bacterium]
MPTVDYAIQDIKLLYDKGLYLQAYHAFGGREAFCDEGTVEERVLRARLAGNLGNSRLGDALRICAYRHNRKHPETVYNYAWKLLGRDGLLVTYEFLRDNQEIWKKAAQDRHAEAMALWAKIHSFFRDFTQAYKLMDEARKIDPGNPWVEITHSEILENEDKLDESLLVAQDILKRGQILRYATQHTADLLVSLNRDDEAIALLYETGSRVESCGIWGQLSALLAEHRRFEEALDTLEKGVEAAPLRREKSAISTAARKFEIYYGLGQFERAREEALKVPDIKYYERMAERLNDKPESRFRKVLPVGFVRQHYDTCAPATLAAISTFLQKPVDHLAIADEICFDGTPDHLERRWADKQGFSPREFRVTWESTVALIDLGLPFALATVGLTMGHLQAVIGYDDRVGTLIIRDPNTRHERETLATEFFESEKANGPRGLVLVPPRLVEAVAALNLPDAALYDENHLFFCAQDKYDRATAAAQLEKLIALDKDHFLTLSARRDMGRYDANPLEELDALEGLLKIAPEDGRLLLIKLRILGRLDRTSEQLELLRTQCATKTPNPVFLLELADQLSSDARQSPEALRLIRRALRMQSSDSQNLRCYAGLLWRNGRYSEALPLYRFAVCLGRKDEELTQAYFMAARFVKESEHALGFLRERWQLRKEKSGESARTLYWALECIHRLQEAFAVLDEAIRVRPEDGDLLCYAADVYARYGNKSRADELMAQAEKRTHQMYWLRTAAQIARYRGDFTESIARWRSLLELNPTHGDAHDSIADLLAETQGEAAALEYLRQTVEKFPQNIAVHKRLSNRLRNRSHGDGEYPEGEKVLRRLIEMQPGESWNHRQLAVYLSQVKQAYPEAIAAADHALELEPNSGYAHQVRAVVCRNAGQHDEARKSFRAAIALDVDLEVAVGRLVSMGETQAQKMEELNFIREQLGKQAVYGGGLLAYREAAYPLLEPEDLLRILRVEQRRHPGMWQAHIVVAKQLADMRRLDEALAVMQEATRQFPLFATVWMELALIHFARHERTEALASFREALVLRPDWGYVSRRMAQIHDHSGEKEEAVRVMEIAVALAPLDAACHCSLAICLRKLGQKEKAWEHLLKSARIDPSETLPFELLPDWCEEDKTPDRAAEFARSVTEERPGDAICWLNLADMLVRQDQSDEFFAAVDKALTLSPRNIYGYDIKAMRLSRLQRHDEALAACAPAAFEGKVPVPLRGRRCWVLAQRDLKEAVKEVRVLLTEQPDYLTGWKWLADWTETLGDKEGSLEAAKRMVHLDPQSFQSYGYLGCAHLALDQTDSAMKEFAHAFALRPSYGYAGFQLLHLQVSRGSFEEGLETLNQLLKHCPGSEAECAVIYLATEVRARSSHSSVNTGSPTRPLVQLPGTSDAMTALAHLCRTDDSTSYRCIAQGATYLRDSLFPWRGLARKVLTEALYDKEAHYRVGSAWFNEWEQGSFPFYNHVVLYRAGTTDAARHAICDYLPHYARKQSWMHVLAALYLRGPLLAEKGFAWGRMGYALAHTCQFERCVQWMKDWKTRDDLGSWMLLNLVIGMRGSKRYEESYEVSLHAVEKLEEDDTHVDHYTNLAVEDAINGRYDKAREYLPKCENGDNKGHSFLLNITRTILEMEDTSKEKRAALFKERRIALQQERVNIQASGEKNEKKWIGAMYARALERLDEQADTGMHKIVKWIDRLATPGVAVVIIAVITIWFILIKQFQRDPQPPTPLEQKVNAKPNSIKKSLGSEKTLNINAP